MQEVQCDKFYLIISSVIFCACTHTHIHTHTHRERERDTHKLNISIYVGIFWFVNLINVTRDTKEAHI